MNIIWVAHACKTSSFTMQLREPRMEPRTLDTGIFFPTGRRTGHWTGTARRVDGTHPPAPGLTSVGLCHELKEKRGRPKIAFLRVFHITQTDTQHISIGRSVGHDWGHWSCSNQRFPVPIRSSNCHPANPVSAWSSGARVAATNPLLKLVR